MRKEGTGLERELIEEFVSGYRPSHTYIFWDRPDIEKMSAQEFVSYVNSLRNGGKREKHELELMIIRFVEAGKISDAVRIFTQQELSDAIEKHKFFKLGKNRLKAWRKICSENTSNVGIRP